MILLSEVAEKINELLNTPDGDYAPPFEFGVETTGFHLDSISNAETGKNFIPTFISQLGGEFDPIPNIKKAAYIVGIAFYFPVRYKEEFFDLSEYLSEFFVGKLVNFGTRTGTCLCNISVPEFGEIQNIDLKEFKEWVGSRYRRKIEVMEPYMTMNLRLFLSTANSNLIYGNSVSYELQFDVPSLGGVTFKIPLAWTQSGTGIQNSPISQQLVGEEDYSKSVVNITNYSKSIMVYYQNTHEWRTLLTLYNNQQMDKITNVKIVKKYNLPSGELVFNFKQVMLSLNENVALGSLLTFTIAFSDAYELESEEE